MDRFPIPDHQLRSFRGWDINFPAGTAAQLIELAQQYLMIFLDHGAVSEPPINPRPLGNDEAGVVRYIRQEWPRARNRRVTFVAGMRWPITRLSTLIRQRDERRIGGKRAYGGAAATYDELQDWLGQDLEGCLIPAVGMEVWQRVFTNNQTWQFEYFELLLAAMVEEVVGADLPSVTPVLELWLAGWPILGFDDAGRIIVATR